MLALIIVACITAVTALGTTLAAEFTELTTDLAPL
jgi:Flp pilus assembly pilin Flp